jgi:hypothetical protein
MGAQSKVNAYRRAKAHEILTAEQQRKDREKRDMVERAADLYEALQSRVDGPTREAMKAQVNKDGTLTNVLGIYEDFIRNGGEPDGRSRSLDFTPGGGLSDGKVTAIKSNRGF